MQKTFLAVVANYNIINNHPLGCNLILALNLILQTTLISVNLAII